MPHVRVPAVPHLARRALLAAVLALGVLAAADAAPAAARDGSVTSFDGTKIAHHFYARPGLAAGTHAPTLMFGPGYGSGGAMESDATVQAAEKHGYNVVTWDPRGFGQSGGQVEVDSPTEDGRDVMALIDMVARQPEAQLDGPGDPRLGMIGASYGGGIQITTASLDPRIDAITPQIAWHSLITSLDKNNTAKGGWGSVLVAAGTQGSSAGAQNNPGGVGPTGRQDPHITQAFSDGVASGTFTPGDIAWFTSRGPGDAVLRRIHVPTLLMQGTDDTLFTLAEAVANLRILQADRVPAQMLWFCGGLTGGPVAHGVCNTPLGPDPTIDTDYALRWLDHYLKGTPEDLGPLFSWVSDAGVLRGADRYPPAAGAPVTAHGGGTLAMAAGDTSGAAIEAQPAANAVSVAIPTPPAGTELLGEPMLSLTYSGAAANPDGRLYAQLVDETAQLVLGNQVTPVPVTLDGASHTVTLPLEAVAADVTAGKRYALQVTDGTSDYFPSREAGAVQLTATVTIPTVAAGAAFPVTAPFGGAKAPVPARRGSARGGDGRGSTRSAHHRAAARRCPATRRLTFGLHGRGGTIRTVRVYVDGRLRLVRHGRRLRTATVTVAPTARHRIVIVTYGPRGRLLRRYVRTVGIACRAR